MIIVDDRLSLDALAGNVGRPDSDDQVATTWSFHFRLVRALGEDRIGALTQGLADEVRRVAASPPPELLVVLDPRAATERAALLAVKHRLNLLAAELVGAALVHSATVRLSAPNVGRHWPEVMAEEGVELEVVDSS